MLFSDNLAARFSMPLQKNSLALQMADLTYQLLDNCQQKLEYIADKLGLSLSEFKCIRAFHGDADLSVKEIAKRMGLTSSRLTRILDGMFEKKIVTRDFDPDDRRVIRVRLTERGKTIAKRLNVDNQTIHEEILHHIPIKSQQDVVRALENLAQAMNDWKKK